LNVEAPPATVVVRGLNGDDEDAGAEEVDDE